MDFELRTHFLFQVYCLQMFIETSLVAFPDAYFGLVDMGPDDAQHSKLANFRQILTSFLRSLSKNAIVGVCKKAIAPLAVAMRRSCQPSCQVPRTNPLVLAGA